MSKIRKSFEKIKTSSILTCLLCYAALAAGYMPFYGANIFANDRDHEYPAALLVMILTAFIFGLFAWLWIQSLQNRRSSYISAIGGIPYFLIVLFMINDVDRVPVYVASMIAPALLFLVQKQRTRSLACASLLAILLFCCLNTSIRIKRYVHNLRGDCMCCGYQQRDIHELILLGNEGCNALAACIEEEVQNERPPWCGWGGVCSYALSELNNNPANQAIADRIKNAMKKEWPNK